MNLDDALSHVAVLGAAGKMGSGIALLLLQEMTRLDLEKTGTIGSGGCVLNLIDVNEKAFLPLRNYLRDQLLKYAEKNINLLRHSYAKNEKLISNEDIINDYVNGALDLICFDTEVSAAKHANLVFEAIVEDIEIKSKVFQCIIEHGNKEGFFLSNTSSIPIHLLDEKADLNHRIIGFHFYNPPAVQKLLEIIAPPGTDPDLVKIAQELAKRLKKIVVNSADVAGFIGNGHMIREVAFACEQAVELSKEYSLTEAIYMVNRVTQEWLIRPMGIFQLMDYVGLDVCRHISDIMSTFLKDPSLKSGLVDQMVDRGIFGGQNPDGTQKDGFFSYAKQVPKGIYSMPEEKYIAFADSSWVNAADRTLGDLPLEHLSWKTMQKEPHKDDILKIYFENLNAQKTLGSKLAQAFLKNSHSIESKLVKDGIAASPADVDTVLMNGFYHLYGIHLFQEVKT